MTADTRLLPIDAESLMRQIQEAVDREPQNGGHSAFVFHRDVSAAPLAQAVAEARYRSENPDVAASIERGEFKSGYDHWLRIGGFEGRIFGSQGTPSADRAQLCVSRMAACAEQFRQVPPLHPTLRGRIGFFLSKILARLLWWQSRTAWTFAQTVCQHASEQAEDLQRLERLCVHSRTSIEAVWRAADGLDERVKQLAASVELMAANVAALRRDMAHSAGELVRLRQQVMLAMEESVRSAESGEQRFREQQQALRLLSMNIEHEQGRRAALDARAEQMESMLLRTCTSQISGNGTGSPQARMGDRLYLEFEDRFRGTREAVSKAQEYCLRLLESAQAGASDRPILDVGCGRGELLVAARQRGWAARGVDLNGEMIAICRGLGLDVSPGEALDFLRALPANHAGAVTAFHVAEHLEFSSLIALIDEAWRVLKPGGILVLETPNPDNLRVGASSFYLDPTHNKPLPREMLRFFVEKRGFERVEVQMLHRSPDERLSDDGHALTVWANEQVYGPQDYAVYGWKPSAPPG